MIQEHTGSARTAAAIVGKRRVRSLAVDGCCLPGLVQLRAPAIKLQLDLPTLAGRWRGSELGKRGRNEGNASHSKL
jgi:hypothetical protein